MNAALRRLPPGNRQILLYIHGFNTQFDDAVSRAAQLSYEVKLPNVPVVFSWASRGNVFDYAYDNNSAMVARAELGRFLMLLEKSDAEKVNVVAHSLGNMLFVKVINSIKLQGGPPKKRKIGLIFLASPDIDYDVFKSQLMQLGRPEVPYFILLSKDDQALGLSTAIAGGRPRLGDYSNPEELASLGATVLDATDIAAQDPAHHDKYAEIAKIAPQLIRLSVIRQQHSRYDGCKRRLWLWAARYSKFTQGADSSEFMLERQRRKVHVVVRCMLSRSALHIELNASSGSGSRLFDKDSWQAGEVLCSA